MRRERWRRVEALFHRALSRPRTERPGFLAEHCPDAELRREVLGLLAGDREADARIEAALRETFRLAARQEREEPARRRIGPYRLLRRLGRGGLGTVYLAERADRQYSLRVAIKLVRRGLDTEDILERFRLERQILASLAHPNIARFLDGGSTEDGLPYLVMEYVEGEPIDLYCFRRLGLEERLELFRRVSTAVHFAHQSLVIHRDLKPSNLLVTAEGVPKLLDFGIAKLLDPERFSIGVSPTAEGIRRLTPEFASPEQIRGEELTTASDLYSLGVLLYLLLAGRHPHRPRAREAAALEKEIAELAPPSAAAARAPEEALPPGMGRARLCRRLEGDLDNIVSKAMHPEPRRRYTSAEQLSSDLERCLAGLPVLARPDTLAYRCGKFLRRHRTGVSAAALALLLSAGSALFYTSRLRLERDRARAYAERSEAVRGFLVRLFEAFDPQLEPADPSAREILEVGLARLDGELRGQPEIRAELKDLVGTLLQQLGRSREALPLLREALRLRRRIHTGDHPEVAASLDHLGDLLVELGDWPRAGILHRQSLAMRLRLWGERHALVAESLHDLGVVAYYSRRHQEARELFERALDLRLRLFGESHPEIAETLNDLGALAHRLGDLPTAEEKLRRALEIRREVLGADHLSVADSLNNLAALPGIEAAEGMVRQALAIHRRRLGDEHLQVALDLHNLAAIREEKGDRARAEELFAEALGITRRSGGDEHPNLPLLLTRIAGLQAEDGRYELAEEGYREALRLRRQARQSDGWRTSLALMELGAFLLARERPGEAEPLLLEAVELRREARAEDWRTALAESLLGEAWTRLGRLREAGPLLERAAARLAAERPGSSHARGARQRLAAYREAAGGRKPESS